MREFYAPHNKCVMCMSKHSHNEGCVRFCTCLLLVPALVHTKHAHAKPFAFVFSRRSSQTQDMLVEKFYGLSPSIDAIKVDISIFCDIVIRK